MPDEMWLSDPYASNVSSDPYVHVTPVGGARKDIVNQTVVAHRVNRENAICPTRALKAVTLTSEKKGHGQYRVASSSRKGRFYDIDVYSDQPCDCEDSQFGGGRQCIHWLHCRMREGDETVLFTAGQIILRAKRILKDFLGDESTEEE